MPNWLQVSGFARSILVVTPWNTIYLAEFFQIQLSHMYKKLEIATLTILFLILLEKLSMGLALAVNTANNFGAIATSSSGAWGISTDFQSRIDAEREALRSCGQRDFMIQVLFDDCGVLVEHNQMRAWGVGYTLEEAQSNALEALDNRGRVIVQGCNTR